MVTQTQIDEKNFQKLEEHVLGQIMDMSKSMIETFKFKLIYATKISEQQNTKTLKALEEFRSKNWDKNVSREEAYKKYLNMY